MFAKITKPKKTKGMTQVEKEYAYCQISFFEWLSQFGDQFNLAELKTRDIFLAGFVYGKNYGLALKKVKKRGKK